MSARLVVVRHAPTRAAGRCIGRSDVEVELAHEEAAVRIVDVVRATGIEPRLVWSSPLERCAGPAAIVARAIAVEHRVNVRLAEIDHGVFEGRAWAELEREEAHALARWMKRWEHEGPPGGESAREVEARVRAWWAEPWHGDGLLVAHAGVARALRVIRGDASWPEVMSLAIPHLSVDAVYPRE